jgi:hypothetical protein
MAPVMTSSCLADRILKFVLGGILLAISLLFPVIMSPEGKIVVSIVGVVLIVLGFIRTCPVEPTKLHDSDQKSNI